MATQPDTAAYAHGAHALLHSQLEEAHSRLTGTRAAIAASRLSSVLRGARANRLSRAWQHWSLAAIVEDARRDEETLRREHARLALELRATLASQVALEARASKAEGAADAFRLQLDANEVQARRSVAEATSRGARLAEESVLQALRSSALRDLLRSLDASRLTFALLRWRAGALAATREAEGAERQREFDAARAGLHALRCKYESLAAEKARLSAAAAVRDREMQKEASALRAALLHAEPPPFAAAGTAAALCGKSPDQIDELLRVLP